MVLLITLVGFLGYLDLTIQKGLKRITPLLGVSGTALSAFMALYIYELTLWNKHRDTVNASLPRWLMPVAYRSIQLLPSNGHQSQVEVAHYYYLVLGKSNDPKVPKQMFPATDEEKEDSKNIIGCNGIAVSGSAYCLSAIPDQKRRGSDDGDEIIIVSSYSSYGKLSIYIEGGQISGGHFSLQNGHLKLYAPEEIVRNARSQRHFLERKAETYCKLFNLIPNNE